MTTKPRLTRTLALYDADCGFCAASARWIPRLGADVDVSSLQAEDLPALGVDEHRSVVEMPVLLPDGRIAWGHHAWAEILLRSTPPLPLLGQVLDSRLLEEPAAAIYHWVATHRHRLPGGTVQCALPPQ